MQNLVLLKALAGLNTKPVFSKKKKIDEKESEVVEIKGERKANKMRNAQRSLRSFKRQFLLGDVLKQFLLSVSFAFLRRSELRFKTFPPIAAEPEISNCVCLKVKFLRRF